MPADLFWGTVCDYARDNIRRLDGRMLAPLHADEQRNGILSVSQRFVINYMLNTATPFGAMFQPDDVVSNRAEMNEEADTMRRITLELYGRN